MRNSLDNYRVFTTVVFNNEILSVNVLTHRKGRQAELYNYVLCCVQTMRDCRHVTCFVSA